MFNHLCTKAGHVVLAGTIGMSLMGPSSTPAAHAASACGDLNSRLVAVGADYIRAQDITDDDWNPFEKHDEFYFVVAGALQRPAYTEEITLGEREHHSLREKRTYDGWYHNVGAYWCLNDGDIVSVVVTLREDDDWASPDVGKLILAGAAAIGGALGASPLLDVAKDQALSAARDFVTDIVKDKVDDTIGAFMVTVVNEGGVLRSDFRPVSNTRMTRYGSTDGTTYTQIADDSGATFQMNGGPSDVVLNMSIWGPQ